MIAPGDFSWETLLLEAFSPFFQGQILVFSPTGDVPFPPFFIYNSPPSLKGGNESSYFPLPIPANTDVRVTIPPGPRNSPFSLKASPDGKGLRMLV